MLKKIRTLIPAIIGSIIVLDILVALGPFSMDPGARFSLGHFLATSILHVSALIVFILGLKGFTHRLKTAYAFIEWPHY